MRKITDRIIIYDDECVLCSGLYRYITKRIHPGIIYFTSFNSLCASLIFKKYNIQFAKNTVYYLKNNKMLCKSAAIKQIMRELKGFSKLIYPMLFIIPTFISDRIYDIVASNRYRWFGKQVSCELSENHTLYIIQDCNPISQDKN